MKKICLAVFLFSVSTLIAESPIIFRLRGKTPDEYKKFSGLYSFSDSFTHFNPISGHYVVVLRGNLDKRFFVSFVEPNIGEIDYINQCSLFEIKIIDSRNPIGDGVDLVRVFIDGFAYVKGKKVRLYTSRWHITFGLTRTITSK